MSKFKFVQWYGIVVCLLMAACTDVDITMPKGPKGDTGLSAYEFWKEKVADGTVDWPKDQTEVADFFKYLKGNDGKDGKDGKSAFDQWKDMIADGSVDNPHNPGSKWPAGNNTVQDFWDFLTGRSSVIEIQVGKYNVIPDYWNSQLREYVIPTDGSVLFTVYDKAGQKVAAGVQVSGLPGVGATETFTTDDNGQFKVTWDKLPDNQPLSRRTGSATVTVGGVQETSAKNTLVPNRVNVRATVSTVYLSYNSSDINSTRYTYVSFKYERQIDGEWNDYPSNLKSYMMKAAKIKDINQPVNEGNLDKSKSYTYSTGETYLYIRRSLVLTPTEKANVAKNDTINGLLRYEWDGNEFYSGLYFGDGAGSYNDYGQTVYLQDKIHIPEIYPAPGFKEGTVFMEIKQGVTTLWGEIDTDQLPDFYKTSAYSTKQYQFTKDPDTGIWKSPEGKLPASDLAEDRAVFIQMRTFINGTGGTVHTGTVPLSKGGKRFILTSAYPGNWIGVDIRRRQKGTNEITYSMSYEYRGRYAYYLLKEGEQYFLVDFADRTKRIPLEIKECPADWMD